MAEADPALMLSSSDQIGIIAHDSGAIPIIPLTRASNRLRIQNAIATISADGGTDIFPAYKMASDCVDEALAFVRRRSRIRIKKDMAIASIAPAR